MKLTDEEMKVAAEVAAWLRQAEEDDSSLNFVTLAARWPQHFSGGEEEFRPLQMRRNNLVLWGGMKESGARILEWLWDRRMLRVRTVPAAVYRGKPVSPRAPWSHRKYLERHWLPAMLVPGVKA